MHRTIKKTVNLLLDVLRGFRRKRLRRELAEIQRYCEAKAREKGLRMERDVLRYLRR